MANVRLKPWWVAGLAGLLAAGALATGCAQDTRGTRDAGGASAQASSDPSPSGGEGTGEAHAVEDPAATPAPDLPGAVESTFTLLDTRPDGTDAVAGTAWLAQGEHGTTLTVTMTGLEPGAEYVGHLHAQECAADNGGPHFKVYPDGSDTPPNEVHIGFVAHGDGEATATVTSEHQVGAGARSVVMHPAGAVDARLACADF